MVNTSNLICTNCSHRNVCKNIDNYKKVIDAIHSISISLRENAFVSICNIEWLKDIEPKCKYYDDDGDNDRWHRG